MTDLATVAAGDSATAGVTSSVMAPLAVDAPIAEVVVLEDRAQVTRRAALTLPAGRSRLRLPGLTPLLADRALRLRLRVAGAAPDEASARLLDFAVERRYAVLAARPERERELRAAIEEAVREYLTVYDRATAAALERDLLTRGAEALARLTCDRAAVGSFDESTHDELQALFERRATLDQALVADLFAQDDRRHRLEDLYHELAAVLAPQREYRATLDAAVWTAAAGEHLLEVEYLVPCALWRPEYSAELARGAGARVSWRSGAVVWQATGEDWRDAALAVSTARPSLGARLPLLEDDLLASREKTDIEKRVTVVESRDAAVAVTQSALQPRETDTPPAVDDGGEARRFSVVGKPFVPSDGRPHHLELGAFETPAETELCCAPARAAFVFTRSTQENRSGGPLLAGPVRLTYDGAFVGRGQVGFVAAGERFELSWGSSDDLVVLRDETCEEREVGLRKHREHAFEVLVRLTSHRDTPTAVVVRERIPVSELEAVKVTVVADKTRSGYTRDEQGILSWTVALAPGKTEIVALAFNVTMPSDVTWRP